MNLRQRTLAALLVLGIGMSGCNNTDNNPTSPTVDKKNKTHGCIMIEFYPDVDDNNSEENRTVDENESTIIPNPDVDDN